MAAELDCDDHAVIKEDDTFTALPCGGKFAGAPASPGASRLNDARRQKAPSIPR
jgi:hypothetical protein